MADLDEKNSAQAIKVVGADSSGVETNYIESGNSSPSLTAQGLVVRNIPKTRATYGATSIDITPATTATDVFTITGSASKTVYIHKITVTGNRTAHAHDLLVLLKRSTANTGGTFTTRTAVPYDSDNDAATATVRAYTANPTLGTLVGEIQARRVSFPVQTPTNAQGNGGSVNPWVWEYTKDAQPITLRGTSEVLAINLNGITIAGRSLQFSIEWSEE